MYNPMTADYFDDTDECRQDAINSKAEDLMADEGWIDAVLADGIDCRALSAALAEAYVPGTTHARVGGLLMDALWELAVVQAEKIIDDGE